MTPVTDPAWLIRLRTVRARRTNELTDRDFARYEPSLSEDLVRDIFSGAVHPERQTLLNIVCCLTNKPGECESVLTAYDRAEADLRAMHTPPPIFDTRTDTQLLADAICDLADAITELTKAIKPATPDHH